MHWTDFSQQTIHSMDFSMNGFSGIQSIEWAQHSQNLEIGSFDFSVIDLSFEEASNPYCGSFQISSPVAKPVASPTTFSFYSGDISIDTSLGEFSGIFSTSGEPYSSYSFSLGEYSYTQISSVRLTAEPSAISTPAPSVPHSAAPSAQSAVWVGCGTSPRWYRISPTSRATRWPSSSPCVLWRLPREMPTAPVSGRVLRRKMHPRATTNPFRGCRGCPRRCSPHAPRRCLPWAATRYAIIILFSVLSCCAQPVCNVLTLRSLLFPHGLCLFRVLPRPLLQLENLPRVR